MDGRGHADRSAVERAFVGREGEIAELRGALDDVIAGSGTLFLVSGEPGIGKTRLVEEFASIAGATGARVLRGRCAQGASVPEYWPWIQAIGSLEPSDDVERVLAMLRRHAPSDERSIPIPELRMVHQQRRAVSSPRSDAMSIAHRTPQPVVDSEQVDLTLFSAVAALFRNLN